MTAGNGSPDGIGAGVGFSCDNVGFKSDTTPDVVENGFEVGSFRRLDTKSSTTDPVNAAPTAKSISCWVGIVVDDDAKTAVTSYEIWTGLEPVETAVHVIPEKSSSRLVSKKVHNCSRR